MTKRARNVIAVVLALAAATILLLLVRDGDRAPAGAAPAVPTVPPREEPVTALADAAARSVAASSTTEPAPAATPTTPARRGPPKGNVTVRLVGPDGPLRAGRIVFTPDAPRTAVVAEIGAQFGEARFEGIVVTGYAVSFDDVPGGWVVSRTLAQDDKQRRGGFRFEVAEGENILDLRVERGAIVQGTVFDENGWPEAEAVVRISSLEPRERWVPAHTVELVGGAFRAHVHAGASSIDVWSTAPKPRVPPAPQPISLAAGERADLEFRFELGTETFLGRIIDERGAPFAGLRVGVDRLLKVPEVDGARPSSGEVRQDIASAKTDVDGRFRIEGLPRGACVVRVEEKGVTPFQTPKEATVARIQQPHHVELPLAAPWELTIERARPVRVRGRVVDAMKRKVWSIDVVLAAGERREKERREDFSISRNDTFELYVDGTEVGAVIEVKLSDQVVRVPLALGPDLGETFVEIQLP